MQPIFCINPYSMNFFSHSIDEFEASFDKIFLSIVKIGKKARKESKSVFIFTDADCGNEYSFIEYRQHLEKRNRDLAYYVRQLQTRTPYYDFINDKEFEKISQQRIYIYGQEYSKGNIFYFAVLHDGCLISVPFERIWAKERIDFSANEVNFSVWNLFDDEKNRVENIINEIFRYENLLDDLSRFEPTGKFYKPTKQQIYKEKTTGYYWYFDFQHKDNKTHFEVFDSTGKHHLGEADMNGIVNKMSAKLSRTIEQYL